MNLFAYGTLVFEPIFLRVVGKNYPFQPAYLKDYIAYCVQDELYPGLVYQPGGITTGKLYVGLNYNDFELLSAYEGDEYTLEEIELRIGFDAKPAQAYTYVYAGKYFEHLTSNVFSLKQFEACSLSQYAKAL